MVKKQHDGIADSRAAQPGAYAIQRRHDHHWEVRDPTGALVCLTVYKRGAQEVVRRMSIAEAATPEPKSAR